MLSNLKAMYVPFELTQHSTVSSLTPATGTRGMIANQLSGTIPVEMGLLTELSRLYGLSKFPSLRLHSSN